MSRGILSLAVLLAAAAFSTLTPAAAPPIRATVFDHTGLRLVDVVWTGSRFLYVENTTNAVWAKGSPPSLFASMPRVVEETRCKLSPGTHGFPAGYLFCHAPDNVIYTVRQDGTVAAFARLPTGAISDGALDFDSVGKFGFRLIAATGRSGAANRRGGTVFAVSAAGDARSIGSYSARGGADELMVAPAGFGTGSGQVVLTVDAGKTGSVVLMDPAGVTRLIATLPDGPNPIVAVPASTGATPGARAGLYVTDTNSTNVFYVPASKLSAYAGRLLVGTEITGGFFTIRPDGRGFRTQRIPLSLPGKGFNLENAIYLG
jgi:hypothetical protein